MNEATTTLTRAAEATRYRDVALIGETERQKLPDAALPATFAPLPITGSPVFVGHYWNVGDPNGSVFQSGLPRLFGRQVRTARCIPLDGRRRNRV